MTRADLLASQIHLHAPMMIGFRSNWRGLRGDIPIQLGVDSPYMTVGKEAHFRIINAPPNAKILWSSYKNGAATGELNAYYNQDTGANGSADLTWTPTADNVGNWVKSVLVQDAAGKNYTAMVQFTVAPASAVSSGTVAAPAPAPSFWDSIPGGGFYVGSTYIPYLVAIGGGLLAWKIVKSH